MLRLSYLSLFIILVAIIEYIVYSIKRHKVLGMNATLFLLEITLLYSFVVYYDKLSKVSNAVSVILALVALSLCSCIDDMYRKK